MGESENRLLMRDYESIRNVVRDTYIKGCYRKSDYDVSGKQYDINRKRIETYIGFADSKKDGKKDILYCKYDMTNNTHNDLVDMYRGKTFTGNDMEIYLKAITGNLQYEDVSAYTNKLRELADEGFVKVEKRDGKNVYSRMPDSWMPFYMKEKLEIDRFLEFCKNISTLDVPFYFLQNKLHMDLKIMKSKYEGEIIYKHTHQFNVIDNEVMLKCLKTINQKHLMPVIYHKDEDRQITLCPIKIIHDCISGRQYVKAYVEEDDNITYIRLDHLSLLDDSAYKSWNKISKGKTVRNKKAMKRIEELDEHSDNVWCTSNRFDELHDVKVEFRFDENEEKFIYARLQRERRGGTLKKLAPGRYLFEISVLDSREITPWIRSFGERAKVITMGDAEVDNVIYDSWKEALKKYESIQ